MRWRRSSGLARVIRRLTAKQAGFAERVDACRAQPRQAGSPDDWLARQNGTSVGDARRAIDTARRLKSSCPATADAFANGELSLGEADAISGAAAVDPAAEAELVAKAEAVPRPGRHQGAGCEGEGRGPQG